MPKLLFLDNLIIFFPKTKSFPRFSIKKLPTKVRIKTKVWKNSALSKSFSFLTFDIWCESGRDFRFTNYANFPGECSWNQQHRLRKMNFNDLDLKAKNCRIPLFVKCRPSSTKMFYFVLVICKFRIYSKKVRRKFGPRTVKKIPYGFELYNISPLYTPFLEGSKLLYKIWPPKYFFKGRASYHFKA